MTATATTHSYGLVAAEYYDGTRHPTCGNFREASQLLFERLLPALASGSCCEVGAGDSLLADSIWNRRGRLDDLLITDADRTMLEYSRRWEAEGACLELARADRLPLPDASLSLLAASLADPYDDDFFWAEAARVLAPGGHCLITTPSQSWAHRFRDAGAAREAAEFELADGSTVALPSFVRSTAEETRLIEGHGLTVVEQAAVPLAELTQPISAKLLVLDPQEPVVNGFLAIR